MPGKRKTRKTRNSANPKKSRVHKKVNSKSQTRRKRHDKKKKGKMSKKRTLKMRGGAIPFSELSTLWDKTLYQFQEFSNPFFDKPDAVAGNASSTDPGVTNQFNRVSAKADNISSPDIKGIAERHF